MRNHILATIAAAVLCVATASGAVGQHSTDNYNRWMTVENRSKLTADNIYIMPSNSDCCWSRDLLPQTAKIRPNHSMAVNFDDGNGTCTFDIRVIGTGTGPEWNFDHINVCSEVTITLKDPPKQQRSSDDISSNDKNNRWMRVNNRSDLTAYYIYIIPSQKDCCWSRDLLGAGVVANGTSSLVNFDDGSRECMFDIRVVTGKSLAKEWNFDAVDVCAKHAITLK